MMPCKILAVLGLALAGPFSIAQEMVERGNRKNPHQPPAWFVRMANPEVRIHPELDSFVVAIPENSNVGRIPANSGVKYSCKARNEKGVLTWQFCDMR